MDKLNVRWRFDPFDEGVGLNRLHQLKYALFALVFSRYPTTSSMEIHLCAPSEYPFLKGFVIVELFGGFFPLPFLLNRRTNDCAKKKHTNVWLTWLIDYKKAIRGVFCWKAKRRSLDSRCGKITYCLLLLWPEVGLNILRLVTFLFVCFSLAPFQLVAVICSLFEHDSFWFGGCCHPCSPIVRPLFVNCPVVVAFYSHLLFIVVNLL